MDCSNNKLLANAFNSLILAKFNNSSLVEYNLSISELTWINEFIRLCPESFIEITNGIKNIIIDNKIDFHDIPAIVKLVGYIINNKAIEKDMYNLDNIKVLIVFVLNTIIYSDLFILPSIEKKSFQIILNTSLELLFFNLKVIEKESDTCFNYLYKCLL